MKIIKIGNKKIGDKQPVFIVAELGINHNGRLGLAKKMIDVAKKAGADAVKLQSFVTEDFVGDKNLKYTYKSQGKTVTESQYKMFKRFEIDEKMQTELFKYAEKVGLIIFSTPQDNSFKTVDFLCSKLKTPVIKVGSDDLTNLSMLAYYARKKKPIIIATGMAALEEVKDAVNVIKKQGNNKIIILKCTSLYPTSPEEANLSQIETLRRNFKDCLIGFSDHTQGSTAAAVAVSLGAVLVEKHITLDHNLPGPDHWFAADPSELTLLVKQVREAEKIMGNPKLVLSPAEQGIKAIARRSIMAARKIKKSEKIKALDLECKRPGTGLPPKYLARFIGKIAKRDYNKGYIFTKKDL
jgi:N-acetylneuraminate synthase/N,N'-diacetyllegionaminate synthase